MSKERAETHVSHVSCCFYCVNTKLGSDCPVCLLQCLVKAEIAGLPAAMSLDHEVCLADEHAERRRLQRTNKIRDAAAEGAKSRMEPSRTEFFFGDNRTFLRSV